MIWVFFLVFTASVILVPSIFTTTDPKVVEISVPMMADDIAIRMITNAATHEISGRHDADRRWVYEYEVVIHAGVLVYSERAHNITREFLEDIRSSIRDVGMNCRVLSVRSSGHEHWPDRASTVIHVPEMTTHTAANIVVSAMDRARSGEENENIRIDHEVHPTGQRVCSVLVHRHLGRVVLAVVHFSVGVTLGR